jgi:hypothetical protein
MSIVGMQWCRRYIIDDRSFSQKALPPIWKRGFFWQKLFYETVFDWSSCNRFGLDSEEAGAFREGLNHR